ncbi:MAG TPA: hypothetical protein VEW28_06565 [Candidatus Kapabacteria bacterium]|nr:hypothetical protein [Candidatus Kapabacteria bacterium]
MKITGFHIAAIVSVGIYIFAIHFVPAQDLPNYVYQGFVFNRVAFHGDTFAGFFAINSYLPPNAIAPVVLGMLDAAIDPIISGKIFYFIVWLGLYSGFYRYIRVHIGRESVISAAIAFYLTFNTTFILGYLNFLAGFALAVHAAATFRQRDGFFSIPLLTGLLLALYICHFIPLVFFGSYVLIDSLTQRRYDEIRKLAISALPVIAIFIHYLLNVTIPITSVPQQFTTVFEAISAKFFMMCSPLIPLHRVKWVTELPQLVIAFNYIFSAMLLAGICVLLVWNGIHRKFSISYWLSLIYLAAAIFLPKYLGGVLIPGERALVLCVLNGIVLFSTVNFPHSYQRLICSVVISVDLIIVSYYSYNAALFSELVEKDQIPSESLLYPGHKLEGTNPFTHFHLYDDIRLHRATPVFGTGILKCQEVTAQ